VPCIESVNKTFLDKSVVVFFPPGRHNNSVAEVARANQVIGRQKLIDCQLPLTIEKKDGYVLHKPEGW
jgi:hypothetical protein